MANVTGKKALTTIDGTPKKRLFLSIISDYDLKTGLCELIDNALDFWTAEGRKQKLEVTVVLDADRQVIQVGDNAGGVPEDQAELLIAPGATRNDTGEPLIGVFGVGGKRAGVALGELVEIRSRHGNGKTIEIDLTTEWIASTDWELEIYQIPNISKGTTVVDISKLRQSFDNGDIETMRQHLGETYSRFLKQGCTIKLNKKTAISPITFTSWAYPPDYRPRIANFDIEPTEGGTLKVKLSAGLIKVNSP